MFVCFFAPVNISLAVEFILMIIFYVYYLYLYFVNTRIIEVIKFGGNWNNICAKIIKDKHGKY